MTRPSDSPPRSHRSYGKQESAGLTSTLPTIEAVVLFGAAEDFVR